MKHQQMALNRILIQRQSVEFLLRATQSCSRSKNGGKSLLSLPRSISSEQICNETRLLPQAGHTRNAVHGGYNRWKLYLGALASLGGAVAYLKYTAEDALCSTDSVEKSNQMWKNTKVTLYQYQTCPFCTKARTFLTYCQIPFEIVEVHPIFKKETKFTKYKKVPIVTIETSDGTHELHDSSLIISVLSTYMANGGGSISDIMKDYPSSEVVTLEGKKKEVILNKYWILEEEPDAPVTLENDPRQKESDWREWTDEHLVHLISPNVYRTYVEAYRAFDHHVKLGKFNGTWEGVAAKVFGSVAMWLISKKLKKKYKMHEDVRLDLYLACNKWHDAIGKGNRFLGGEEPNLADLSVFAVLSVMEGLVSFDDMMKNTKIKPWYFRMKKAIEARQAS